MSFQILPYLDQDAWLRDHRNSIAWSVSCCGSVYANVQSSLGGQSCFADRQLAVLIFSSHVSWLSLIRYIPTRPERSSGMPRRSLLLERLIGQMAFDNGNYRLHHLHGWVFVRASWELTLASPPRIIAARYVALFLQAGSYAGKLSHRKIDHSLPV